ncbi:MAG: anti-sigma factor family protein [Hyphomicrobiales bacterium]
MMHAAPVGPPTDADLVAHLDGELPAEQREWLENELARDDGLRKRRALLESGGRPFGEAFEPLLAAAPRTMLRAMLEGLPAYRAGAVGVRTAGSGPLRGRAWPRLVLLAAGVLLFLAGAVVQRTLPALREAVGVGVADEAEDDWRQAAAQYVSLYTPDTLIGIPDEAAPREVELARVSAKLGITLPLAGVSLPGLMLKRAQLLQYDGKPLGQIAYLDPRDGAMALCIYTDGHPDRPPVSEQRVGLNIVHWSSRGWAFMLVGHLPVPRLREFASLLSQRLTL